MKDRRKSKFYTGNFDDDIVEMELCLSEYLINGEEERLSCIFLLEIGELDGLRRSFCSSIFSASEDDFKASEFLFEKLSKSLKQRGIIEDKGDKRFDKREERLKKEEMEEEKAKQIDERKVVNILNVKNDEKNQR